MVQKSCVKTSWGLVVEVEIPWFTKVLYIQKVVFSPDFWSINSKYPVIVEMSHEKKKTPTFHEILFG